jgi:two-component system, NarL family, sensor kinase
MQLETGRRADAPVDDFLTESPGNEALSRQLRRMAFDVHDGPMQDLIGIAYRLRTLRKTAADSVDPAVSVRMIGEIDELTAQMASTEQMLRSLMFTLEQSAAPHSDLMAAVSEHVEAFKREVLIPVRVVADGDLELYTDSQRIAVSRVLRESLTNIAKHADASEVAVDLYGNDEVLLLSVCDNGRGFDAGAVGPRGTAHRGLTAMRERLRFIGGSLIVESQPGGPTTVTATIQKWRPPADPRSRSI